MNWYGLIIFLSVFVAWKLSSLARPPKIKPENWEKLFFLLFPAAIVGARLYHVADYHTYYSQHPTEIFALWHGGLGIWGAIITGIIFIFLFAKHYELSFFSLTDSLALGLPLAQALGRLANPLNHEGFGYPTTLPWGQKIASQFRPALYQNFDRFHPSWAYESILNLFLFLFLFFLWHRNKRGEGLFTALYLAGYGLIRFLVEFTRHDTWQVGQLKIAALLSFLSFFTGLTILFLKKPYRKPCRTN